MSNTSDVTLPRHFCPAPWQEIHISTARIFSSCCRADGPLGTLPGDTPFTAAILEEAWNGEAIRALRAATLNPSATAEDFPPACRACAMRNPPLLNLRHLNEIFWNTLAPESLPFVETLRQAEQADCFVPQCRSVIVDITRRCPAACRVCYPSASSGVAAITRQAAWSEPTAFDAGLDVAPGDEGQLRALAAALAEFLPAGAYLAVNGGEPCSGRECAVFLDELSRHPLKENIIVALRTGATGEPDEALELLGRFPLARAILTMNGTESLYEYEHPPLTWDAYERRATTFVAAGLGGRTGAAILLTAYNALDLANTLRWCLLNGLQPEINLPWRVEHLSARVLPASARRLAAERLRNFLHETADFPWYSFTWGCVPRLRRIADWLDSEDFPEADADCRRDFMRCTNDLDALHGQEFRLACPELFTLWEKEYGPWDDACRFVTPDPEQRALTLIFREEIAGMRLESLREELRETRREALILSDRIKNTEQAALAAEEAARAISDSVWRRLGQRLGLCMTTEYEKKLRAKRRL